MIIDHPTGVTLTFLSLAHTEGWIEFPVDDLFSAIAERFEEPLQVGDSPTLLRLDGISLHAFSSRATL